MANPKKKSSKEVSDTFHKIIAASVKENKKPSIDIVESEKFYRKGKDYLIIVTKYGESYRGEICKIESVVNGEKEESVEDVLTICKNIIDNK